MNTQRMTERNNFVTFLLFFALLLLIGKLWERRFWGRVVEYIGARTYTEGTQTDALDG